MGNNTPPLVLYPTRIDIPPEIRIYLTTVLSHTLACTLDLRSQVKQAGWNVKGTDFLQLHALCALLATDLEAYADQMAERLVILGGVAVGTARTVTAQSTLPEYLGDLVAGRAHVCALAERFALYATVLRASSTHAADVGDAVTAAIYTEVSRGIEKRLWMLDAYLHT